MKKIKIAVIITALISTGIFFTPVVKASPIYDTFENGIATSSFFNFFSFSLTAEDLNENTLQNNGAGKFYTEEETYIVEFSLETNEFLKEPLEPFLFGYLMDDDYIFLDTISLMDPIKNISVMGVTGTYEFYLLGGLDIFGCRIPLTKTSIEVTVSPVPEPATMTLFGFGLLGLAKIGRRKRSVHSNL